MTVACTNRVAEAAHAKTRLHTWRGPRLPRLLLSSVAEGNGTKAPEKAHKSAPAWAPPPHPLSLARACSTLPASACRPLSYRFAAPSLSLSSLVSASLLIRRPLPLYKKRLFLTRVLSSDPFLEAPGCLLRTRAPAERSGGAEPAPAPADLSSRRGCFASVR